MVKMTFTLDDETVGRIRQTAARLARPQSQVVRDAVRDYASRIGRLSEDERRRLLHAFDTLVPMISPRPVREVVAEIEAVRTDRRSGGRARAGRRA
jgi:hypothetical protein